MNSPYMGDFRVSQQFKGSAHDGLDLVGVDSKEIHSTVNGYVERAGWENPANHSQGFGKYVRIRKNGTNERYYFGHLSDVRVNVGDTVKITQVIGIEGSTGYSTGSHCHYCVRDNASKAQIKDVSAISGIPNAIGTYNDGYAASNSAPSNVYFAKYTGTSASVVTALKTIGADSSMNYRKIIAAKNGIANYSGTASQNIAMVNLLKQGKLIKP